MTSQTSRPHRMVLFYESGQKESSDARHELTAARQQVEDDLGSVAVMNVSYCNAVCVAYGITKCPTCIIFDGENNAQVRVDNPKHLTSRWFLTELNGILYNRRFNALSL